MDALASIADLGTRVIVPLHAVADNWRDPGQFRIDDAELSRVRAQLGNCDQPVVCFIANLGYEPQIPQLIEVHRRSPDSHLILAGDGPCREIASRAASENANISYLRSVSPGLIPLYMAASDVLLYGFDRANPNARFSAPNKLFETLDAGKLVITGDFGEIGKTVSRERCGVVVRDYSVEEITSALKILRNSDASRMSITAKTLTEPKYNWLSASDILLAACADLSRG